MNNTLQAKLALGLVNMGLQISPDKQSKLIAYVALIEKWNVVHNLTAIRAPLDMVTLHLLDSLSVLSHMQQLGPASLLDVGAGAGLPSIPLAICMTELQVTAIEAVQKKVSFMRQVKGELNLTNFHVELGRVEAWKKDLPQQKFDVIISRAFAEINLFIKLTKHLLAENGQWLAMKGHVPEHEFASLDYKVLGIQPAIIKKLNVANLKAERHLILLKPI